MSVTADRPASADPKDLREWPGHRRSGANMEAGPVRGSGLGLGRTTKRFVKYEKRNF